MLAITSVLVSLLIVPLVQSFSITQRTQINVRSQDAARMTLEQVTREIQGAIFVYDNTGMAMRVPIAGSPGAPSIAFDIPYARVDLVLPKMMMHCNDPDHDPQHPRDYPRGDLAWPACPYDGSLNIEARPANPLQPGDKIVRYFVGLKDPTKEYSNGFENNLALATDIDNTFVLYRVEFNPADENLIDNSNNQNGLQRPDFFYNQNRAPNGKSFAANWQTAAKVVGPSKDVDLIRIASQDSNGNPTSVLSSIKFVPNRVLDDVLTPTDVGRVAEGEPFSPPTTYRATSGQWGTDYQVKLYRNNFSSVYYTMRDPATGHVSIYKAGTSSPVFDITAWDINHTITPANPEIMFTVDPNKGEVSFEFPMPVETWLASDIQAMNENFANDIDTGAGALRLFQVSGMSKMPPAARIVPGSEKITGPNWNPGPGYGTPILYTRVSSLTDDPGPNEYRINYRTGEIVFYSLLNPCMPDDGADLQVRYSVQTNQGFESAAGDIMSADYVTKNLLSVQVAYRIYDDRGKAIQLALTNNVMVRNFHR